VRQKCGKLTAIDNNMAVGLINPNGVGLGQFWGRKAVIPQIFWAPAMSQQSVNFNELELSDELGSGSYGVVYRATFRDETVAVKVSLPVNRLVSLGAP
jgi:hypothetical protein